MTEYFDVLDENGIKTGAIKPREEVHRDGDWHRAVYVWILNSKKELLLQKRSPEKDSHPNFWDISAAGHVLAGKNSLETAVREVEEELGLKIKESDLEYLYSYNHRTIQNNGTFINGGVYDEYLLKIDLDLSNLKLQKEEVSDVKFINYVELEELVKNGDPTIVPHPNSYSRIFKIVHKRYNKTPQSGVS